MIYVVVGWISDILNLSGLVVVLVLGGGCGGCVGGGGGVCRYHDHHQDDLEGQKHPPSELLCFMLQ